MRFKIESEVLVTGIGVLKHTHEQEFEKGSNVFGRVLEYRQYMYKTFPNCRYRLIKAKEI